MKKALFQGAATALITPFRPDGTLDLEGLETLIEFQIQNGIQALVLSGTTGEGSTLSFEEFSLLIATAAGIIRHRVPLIAGTGSNHTAKAIKFSLEAEKRGADALLVVTPYYNKTTQEGLIQHYLAIADRVKIPLILYHIPSRTGMKIEPETLRILSAHSNIAAIKEASGDISGIAAIAAACPDLTLYSGNDDQILPILSLGGKGIISVLSNIAPREVQNICTLYESGETERATKEQLRMVPLIQTLFSKVNPIPVKRAVELMGLPAGAPRLPLVPCDTATEERIRKAIKEAGL
ncbi:MAG: 4-hydroxy-tetrahydrodipicolinate synthase [Clostridiales bacterium]|nr:MAG: 4-hydroxy-tetrahydrodipicolinate synthase [Clostridiales bacterium]